MARDNTADEIKSRLDIVELVSEYVSLKRSGRNFKGLCPFHSEKSPSFMVNPERQMFHCFGCSAGGDAFAFVMKYENLTFPETLELLAKRTGVEIRKQSPKQQGERQRLRAMQQEALRYFQQALPRDKNVLQYIAQRGITQASVEKFSMGYAPDGWHNLRDHLRHLGFGEQETIRAGLVAAGQKGSYDIFRSRLMFAINDIHGDPIAFGGRILGDGQPKYLNSPDTPLFNKSETLYALDHSREGIRRAGRAAVAEGYLDAIMCHQHGLDFVVAPLGTALTQGHLRKLARYTEEVVLLFDGDAAGIAAAQRSLPLIIEGNLRASVLLLPEGEDPASLLQKEGTAALEALLERAMSPVAFLIERSGSERARQEAIELIARVQDPVTRDALVLELSERTRISEHAIREKLMTYRRTGEHGGQKTAIKSYNEEIFLLSAALHKPEVLEGICERISLAEISDPVVRSILESMREGAQDADDDSVQDGEAAGPLRLAKTDEQRALLTRLMVEPGFDADDLSGIVEDCLKAIARKGLAHRIREAEEAGDWVLLKELLAEKMRRADTGING